MDYADKYLMQCSIASTLDRPSVYMGGPSAMSMRKAKYIVDMIVNSYDVTPNQRMVTEAVLVRTWLKPTTD